MSDYSELRKLQDIIDNQADRILDLEALLWELIDIEGPQPGTTVWANKVRTALAQSSPPERPKDEPDGK